MYWTAQACKLFSRLGMFRHLVAGFYLCRSRAYTVYQFWAVGDDGILRVSELRCG